MPEEKKSFLSDEEVVVGKSFLSDEEVSLTDTQKKSPDQSKKPVSVGSKPLPQDGGLSPFISKPKEEKLKGFGEVGVTELEKQGVVQPPPPMRIEPTIDPNVTRQLKEQKTQEDIARETQVDTKRNEYNFVKAFKSGVDDFKRAEDIFTDLINVDVTGDPTPLINRMEQEYAEYQKRGVVNKYEETPAAYVANLFGNQAITISGAVGLSLLSPIVGIAYGGIAAGSQSAGATFEQDYYELRDKGLSPEEAYRQAYELAQRSFGFGAVEGTAGAFVPAGKLATGVKEATKQVAKDALFDVSLATVAQGAQNEIEANKGLSRELTDGMVENATGEAVFSIIMGSFVKGREVLKNKPKVLYEISQAPEEVIQADLEARVENGVATPEEAEAAMQDIIQYKEKLTKVPDNFTDEQKQKSVELMTQRDELQASIEGKDEALVKPQKEQINLINTQLEQIANEPITRDEIRRADAVEESVGEQPRVSETGVEETVTEEISPEVVMAQMKPITDEMARVEMEFSNNGYKIDWDYDNEITVTDKRGELVEPEDLPENLLELAGQYEKATAALGNFDYNSYFNALQQSRQDIGGVETEFEEVKPLELAAPAIPEQGEEVQLEPRIKGGQPRIMVYDEGVWKEKVGKTLTEVSSKQQQEAQEKYANEKPSPEKMDVGEQARDGEEMGERNPQEEITQEGEEEVDALKDVESLTSKAKELSLLNEKEQKRILDLAANEATLSKQESQELSILRRKRDKGMQNLEREFRDISERNGGETNPKSFNRQDRQQWRLLQRELQMVNEAGADVQQTKYGKIALQEWDNYISTDAGKNWLKNTDPTSKNLQGRGGRERYENKVGAEKKPMGVGIQGGDTWDKRNSEKGRNDSFNIEEEVNKGDAINTGDYNTIEEQGKIIESTAKALEGVDKIEINKKQAILNAEKIDKGSGSHVKKMSLGELNELARDMISNEKYYQDKLQDAQGVYNLTVERIQELSEAYHKAKADGSNPELVAAVEELLGQKVSPSVQVETKPQLEPEIKSNLEKIQEETGTNFREIQNVYNKYGEGKPLNEITVEDYRRAEAKRQEAKSAPKVVTSETIKEVVPEKTIEAVKALTRAKKAMTESARTKVEETAKDAPNFDKAKYIMDNLENIKAKLLESGKLTTDCKWG